MPSSRPSSGHVIGTLSEIAVVLTVIAFFIWVLAASSYFDEANQGVWLGTLITGMFFGVAWLVAEFFRGDTDTGPPEDVAPP